MVNAGLDQLVALGASAQLRGAVLYTNAVPLVTRWQLYAGPGAVTFAATNQTNTTASFSVPGVYTLTLSASNGVHTVAYDAVVVTAQDMIRLSAARSGGNVTLSWSGGRPPYTVQWAGDLPAFQWSAVVTTNATNVAVPASSGYRFYRVVN